MTFKQFLLAEAESNYKKAKKIQANAKSKAKKNNPGEPSGRSGWEADPHQGIPSNPRISG